MTRQEKAALTKRRNADARIWDAVSKTKERVNCNCVIEPGMDWEQLRPLGGGCTDQPYRAGGRFVCPTLDQYRRLIGGPPTREEEVNAGVL